MCSCRWCGLARLNGPAFLLWQIEVRGKNAKKVQRLCQECFMGISDGSRHHCSVSTLDAVRNLTNNLPKDVQEKLALEILMFLNFWQKITFLKYAVLIVFQCILSLYKFYMFDLVLCNLTLTGRSPL